MARVALGIVFVASVLLATGCGERPAPRASVQAGPANASSQARIRALENTPQAREWLGQQRFERDARDFVRDASKLPAGERERRAQALETQIEAREQSGELSAGETVLLRAALIEAGSGSEEEQKARLAALAERYRADAARREAAFVAQQNADPRMQRYKAREKAVVAEVMAMTTIPGGLTRDEYLRERLQRERELAFDGH
ncbi:hypothetical protein FNZ56_01580 [Pseudoluteimonas lycopersici]|uniref:Lipase modulator n=1 Tax=Pseudoluteimonas lycopersici TaxID=1324796 RepID=A0A516V2B2_9GAMM|nr:hypothetical protein [Lysobacter lycopersici]QDQ72658.1 hypothetical protein FNZ56_01580 [Lysobacter lycopersici]